MQLTAFPVCCILKTMIELCLPAGNLETALVAFKAGADAVYFGMKAFSARAGAENFSEEDLSKIRQYALDNNKKIYITVNTLLDDDMIEEANRLLAIIEFYGADGVIVQDLGLAHLIKSLYPSLPLHGSTQLAVHTVSGVKALEKLGFERVVLSRELTLKEIEAIRKACPDIELKVFIHGAMCYGFSGLCMASWQICSRSANGGRCAQICRTWFTEEETGKDAYFFSMKDLDGGAIIKTLDEMGIDSVKVEGRMKNEKYVAAVTRYYRAILDGNEYKTESDLVKTTFSRISSDGYFNYKPERESLVETRFPSHMGLEAGIVTKQDKNTVTIRSQIKLAEHDGLQIDGEKFPVKILSKKGNDYTLSYQRRANLIKAKVWKLSDASQNEKKISANIRKYKKPIDISITLRDDGMTIEAEEITSLWKAEVTSSENTDFKSTLEKVFSRSGECKYTLSHLTYKNESKLEKPFIPPSKLNEIRRNFYAKLEERPIAPKPLPKITRSENPLKLPPREKLQNVIFFPPVTFDEQKLFKEIEEKAKTMTSPLIGLNNIGQLEFAKAHPEYTYFADIYLYLSNRYAAAELSPYIQGGYLWCERESYDGPWPFEPSLSLFTPPIFISRSCFRHDSLGLSCEGCGKKWDYEVSQTGSRYKIRVRNCLTLVDRLKN